MKSNRVSLVRFWDLEPSWDVPRAKEPGYLRWLVSWLGGPAGTINFNPGVVPESERATMGFMAMPQGNRQAGLHRHTVTEIYVILCGMIEGFDHTGVSHRAGPLDCIYIPAGVPHGVRTCGDEDLQLVWVHDAPERFGASVYMDGAAPSDSDAHISIVRFQDLEPFWDAPGAKDPASMRWLASYVGGAPGQRHYNRQIGCENARIGLGLTVLSPAARDPLAPLPCAATYLLLRGQMVVRIDGVAEALAPLDAVHVPAGEAVVLRNLGDTPATVLWLHESPVPEM